MARILFACLVLLGAWLPENAAAVTYTFNGITNNNAGDTTVGETQLSVNVTDAGGGLVRFELLNAGPAASSITDIYFDDAGLFADLNTIQESAGVSFSEGASPGNLPGGNSITPKFTVTTGLLADSDPPVQPNGVNPGEWVAVYLALAAGQTFADVLADLADLSLRIGIHVQGFFGGGSESFINNPSPIPLPPAVVLLGTALAGLSFFRIKRRAQG
jgi:hypothetical protein